MQRFLPFALLIGAVLPAQDPTIRQAVINPSTQRPEAVRTMPASLKGTAVTADGSLWALIYYHDGASDSSSTVQAQNASRFLLLYVSKDGGRSWSQATRTRTSGSTYGSMAVDPDGYTLHVAWYAWNGKLDTSNLLVTNIFYSAYDTRTGTWAGTKDEEIVPGTNNSSGAYSWADIAITPKGVIGVTFGCARGVPAGWVGASGSWLAGFLWKTKGGVWSAPHQLSLDGCGVYANIQAIGEEFHTSYRTVTGGYGVCYRRFDAAAQQFGPEGEIPFVADPANPTKNISNLYANNNCHVGLLANGDIYALYATGTSPSAGGKLMYVIAPAGTYAFGPPMQIDDDPSMGWGNNAYWCHVLTRVGGSLAVVYSKVTESYQNLYMRNLTPLGPLPPYPQPPIPLRPGTAGDQFMHVNGQRDLAQNTTSFVTWTDLRPVGPFTGGRAVFGGGSSGFAVWKGAGCQGTLAKGPRLSHLGTPGIGTGISLLMADHPAGAAAVLFLGFNDRLLAGLVPLPFDLSGLGMTACLLAQDLRLGLPYAADATGNAAQGVPVPNDPNLSGLPAFWQSFVFAPTATPGGLVLTNGLSTVLR